MLNKIECTVKPDKFLNLNNGIWYYNYDIVEKVVNTRDMNGKDKEETRYEYILIRVDGKPEYKKCVELIIREFITLSQEFDLINSYNLAKLEGIEDSKAITDYLEYLLLIKEIKSKIKKDFE